MVVREKNQRTAGSRPRGSTNRETDNLHGSPCGQVPAAPIIGLLLKYGDRRNHIKWQMPWE